MLKRKFIENFESVFKKIYFILCFFLGLFLLIEIINHINCLDGELADLCYVSYNDSLLETIIENTKIFLISILIYFIIRWVYLNIINFKK